MDDREARDRVGRIDALLDAVDGFADPAARDAATELVQSLVDLYGEGLARIMACADGLSAALAEDEVVAHLLILHGLHPVPLDERVRGALDEVRPYLASHGGDVELLGVDDSVARLRLKGSCSGCPSSTVTLKLAVEDAIHKAAPDVERIDTEGAVEAAPVTPLLRIEVVQPARDGAWLEVGTLDSLPSGAPVVSAVAGEPVLFVRLGRAVYAYRPRCPACDAPLAEGALTGARLTCGGCGLRFDVHRAGRCLDDAGAHLEPVPLLTDADGTIRVALGVAA
jgi:Fe-S cluster biogenesis protein NfuA/nitrite reductase/ring-hydroxylating ferredoxin subunit